MMTRIVFVLSLIFVLFPSLAYADMIEVKGRGFISGVIVSENERELVFKDNYGTTTSFLKSEVTHIEKEGIRRKEKISFATAKGSFLSVKKAVVTAKKEVSGASGGDSVSGLFEKWGNDNLNLVERINGTLDQISQSALDFLFRGQDMGALVSDIQKRATNLKEYKSQNLVIGGIGMAIMFFGFLAVVVFGFRVIGDAFEKSFLWGAAFLAVPLSYAAPLLGGSVGLFVMIPYFASLCFIAIHWRIVRPAVIAQIFSVNVILLGYFILQWAS